MASKLTMDYKKELEKAGVTGVTETSLFIMQALGVTIKEVIERANYLRSEEYIMKLAMSGIISWKEADDRMERNKLIDGEKNE